LNDPQALSIQLLRKYQAGDPEALNELFRRYGPRILGSVRSRLSPKLRSRIQSTDIVQEVLKESISSLTDFQPTSEGALLHWFSTVAANRIRDLADYLTAQKRSISDEIPLDVVDANEGSSPGLQLRGSDRSPSQIFATNEESRLMEEALDVLSPEYREVIVLRDFEGLDFKEIGQSMERSPDAVRMLHKRAISQLAEEVQKKMV